MSLVLSTLNGLAAARDDSDRFRIATELMRYATPKEIKLLADNPAIVNDAFRGWLVELDRNVGLHRPARVAYGHRRLSTGVSLYANAAATGPKTLVMGFCGTAHLLCSPTAVLLQYFPDDAFDFAVVRDMTRTGFSAGSFGYADSFPKLVERLRNDLAPERYREVRCFGVSSGGAPSLAAGAMLGAAKSACFCGRPPTYSASYGSTAASAELERILKNAGIGAEASIVFAAHNQTDVRNAKGLAGLVGARLVPIEDLSDHNVMTPLHRRGDLDAMFRSVGLR